MKIFSADSLLAKKQRWPLLMGLTVLIVLAGGVIYPGLFLAFGVHAIHPIFSDLIAILAAGEAAQQGWDVYASNPLDPLNRPHVYGPWWLVTGELGLVRTDAWWIGLLLALVFVVVAVKVLAPHNRRTVFVGILLLVSPPVILGIERGNNDLIIFLFLSAAVWLVTRVSRIAAAMAAGLIIVAVALKLYPVAALAALAAKDMPRRRMLLFVVSSGLVCGWVILSDFAEYQLVAEVAPMPMTIFGYGAKLTYFLFIGVSGKGWWMLLGGLPVVILFLWVCFIRRRELWNLVPMTGFTAGCYVAGALCWCLCYLSTINFAYRMVLLLLPARLWLQKESTPGAGLAVRTQWIGTLLLFWTPRGLDQMLQWNSAGDYFDGPPLSWILIGTEQALVAGVSITLLWALVGWGWRRLFHS